jgi:putative ABC transport system ATP-binding protein
MENIVKTFGVEGIEVKALQGVNISIDEGEFVSIMGHSGSGKSTLMNILGCLDRPTSGEYHLKDKDVARLSDDELALIRNETIGFVFQVFNLLPRTNCIRNVELPLIYSHSNPEDRRNKTKELLKRVGLEDRMKHSPSELSGGERQRVAIARALVNDPKILLADEPTGNLDSVTAKEILNIFNELHSEGKTVILVTHESYVATCADRIISLHDGKVISDGSKDETLSTQS